MGAKWIGMISLIATLLPVASWADVPIDKPRTLVLPPSNGHRIYLTDMSISHSVDARVRILDGDTFRFLGDIQFGQFAFLQLSKDGRTIYHAGSFFSRADHGTYSEVLEFYDPASLMVRSELELPKARASTLNYEAFMVESAGSRFLFIQNATPASSVTVVDLPNKKVLAQIQTAGCFGIFPSSRQAGRFATLCGDGSTVTIGFDATGKENSRKRSPKLFDPDKDALFITGVADGDRYLFMSFLGNVHPMDMSGDVVKQDEVWPIVTDKKNAAEGWRPGGYQLLALNEANHQLYVGMHPHGKEGSHKEFNAEIWRIDLASHSVVKRGPGEQASYLVVTQEPKPVVYSWSPVTRVITKHDGTSLKVLGHSPVYSSFEGGGPMIVR